jgi:hypothetical protein
MHATAFAPAAPQKPVCIRDPDVASEHIRKLLEGEKPAMIARIGSNEITCIANYLSVKSGDKSLLKYIQGKLQPWWWNTSVIEQMEQCAGFFPPEIAAIERFCELMVKDIPQVDLLGSWLPLENLFDAELRDCIKVDLELLNPYFSHRPWTRTLQGKVVLVIHPFAASIEAQYRKRELLFKDDLLPGFALKTIKAVQSIAGEATEFADWFAALDSMKQQMDRADYDIALIGCGAYGLPLAAHAKRQGKKGFHIGGSLQLMFGIRGKRWENPNYNPFYDYSKLVNEHWIKPAEEERPRASDKVENACYW